MCIVRPKKTQQVLQNNPLLTALPSFPGLTTVGAGSVTIGVLPATAAPLVFPLLRTIGALSVAVGRRVSCSYR